MPTGGDAACAILPTPVARAESATVVLTWTVTPENVPQPTNPGERFLFDHAYETLVRADCLGRPLPGLAASWTSTNGGTRLRITLRAGARFWNGDAVTAGDVIASWSVTARTSSATVARQLAGRTVAIDDRTLEIDCADPSPNANLSCAGPAALGDPELAVVRRTATVPWAEGTGPYRVRDAALPRRPAPSARPTRFVLEPFANAGAPHLTIHAVDESSARDLVDAGIDLLLTEDRSLAAYAATRPDVAPVPLPWDRTWVLVTRRQRPGGLESAPGTVTVAERTLAFRSALARDAVRADARATEGPHWWDDPDRCSVPTGPQQTMNGDRSGGRVAYRRDEPVARALAERLVALASQRGGDRDTSLALVSPELVDAGARATAVGLAPNVFGSALRDGTELAFVVSLRGASLAPCRDLERLLAAAPWLAREPLRLTLATSIAPLLDTRLNAVARRDRLGLSATWDHTITVAPLPTVGAEGRR